MPRCPNGTRKNKKTGLCEEVKAASPSKKQTMKKRDSNEKLKYDDEERYVNLRMIYDILLNKRIKPMLEPSLTNQEYDEINEKTKAALTITKTKKMLSRPQKQEELQQSVTNTIEEAKALVKYIDGLGIKGSNKYITHKEYKTLITRINELLGNSPFIRHDAKYIMENVDLKQRQQYKKYHEIMIKMMDLLYTTVQPKEHRLMPITTPDM
jgi:hypothetical protein